MGGDGGILNWWKNMRNAREMSGGRGQSCGRGMFLWNGLMVVVGGGGAVGRVVGGWGQGGAGGVRLFWDWEGGQVGEWKRGGEGGASGWWRGWW